MHIRDLLRWQWQDYARYHQSHGNLWLHLFAVPLFLSGNAALVASVATGSWLSGIGAVSAMTVSIALQGRGHKAETVPSAPFTGPANAVARIFCEQWVTFPRFVLSGRWWRARRTVT
jgi:hypothetical protein